MPTEILMPALSPTMEDGTLSRWHVAEGQHVAAGDLLAEIETEKATMEFEAVDAGIMGRILVPEGTRGVKVNTPIGLLLAEGEHLPETQPSAAPASGTPARGQSPNPTEITGPLPPPAAPASGEPRIDALYADRPHREIPVEGMRGIIARRLSTAQGSVPHFTLRRRARIDDLLKLRRDIAAGPAPLAVSLTDLIVRAVALAMQRAPRGRSLWAGDRILELDASDISVAVAVENGLFTPVIRDAETKSLRAISDELRSLTDAARNGSLQPPQYQGGTLTISNLGMFGVDSFDAVVNPPQGAILAVGAARTDPVFVGQGVEAATTIALSLTIDHRVMDGVEAASLLGAIVAGLEAPATLLL
ncbi:2-oxo acid dehydrogenase subunit E2 [Mesobaculum littorinae]|uniref:Dihydrolipoamide acetyltransferase component of pyruvate dehydrogenase complex n=1 Tax=Mesobaculum littorinae TaxID=2486419 RepID=A0A438AK32_9RHOB|nr:dihydrolipoamide acetyltransferase family protein [Mesobaculum littorinae]RVV99009.1 2-oxo acid dehydrogenase subunit E2 [Mesobaculum littorinae]